MSRSLRSFQDELRKVMLVTDTPPVSSALWPEGLPARLHVYQNNIRGNWMDTLDHDFPLTKSQFSETDWSALQYAYFKKHPPKHWELNNAISNFPTFVETQKIPAYVKELADYEWNDVRIFINRAPVRKKSGVTNPTVVARPYHHQIFYWVQEKARPNKPPEQKPEVLVFYRDSKNTSHIEEADPLMLLLIDHFQTRDAKLEDLEPIRNQLLPNNRIPLEVVFEALRKSEILLF